VVNIVDRKNKKFWLYFAEGRFFYKQDDLTTQRKLFGIQEPCFDFSSNSISSTCTSTVALADLQNQTTSPITTLTAGEKGWYINLGAMTSSLSAERVISSPGTDYRGGVFFLSFSPTADICGFGGSTYLWAVDYRTGGGVTYLMKGKALVQVSTGEIKDIDLSTAFTRNEGRTTEAFPGIPPAREKPSLNLPPPPIKQFMHVQEQ